MPKPLLIKLPDHLWAKLQTLRTQGFTASGYIRALLERELAEVPPTSPGQHPVTRPANLKAKRIVRERESTPSPKGTGPWASDGQGGLRR